MHGTISGSREKRDRIDRSGGVRLAVALVSVLLVLCITSCRREDPRLQSMVNLEPTPPPQERIEELREVIEENEAVVAQALQSAVRQADALKLLAQEYMRQELYGPALDALEEAIRIEPRNQVLHYLAGVAAGFLGSAQAQPDVRAEYYARAERSYEIAIDIAPNYIEARYGIAVLYVFEMEEPVQAIPHLERVLERNESHVPSLFVLARAHVALGNIDDAIDAYDQIIQKAPDRETRRRAERNRQLLLGGTD